MAELGKVVEEARRGGRTERKGEIRKLERGGRLELSHAQERLWFLDKYEVERSIYNIPLTLRLEGELKVKALEGSLNEIVRRHEALRTRMVEREGEI